MRAAAGQPRARYQPVQWLEASAIARVGISRPADHVRPGYHRAEVGSHILFFRRGEAGVIDIIRILHQRMDIDRHL